MNLAVIGTGNVGRALGVRWARRGHRVAFGSRQPGSDKVGKLLAEAGETAAAQPPAEAAAGAEVVVLATPWDAAQEAVRSLGDLGGKVLVDCTNPLAPDLSGLVTDGGGSGGEQVAAWARGARVVKAFNTTGAGNMRDPAYGPRLMMPLCGDDPAAKETVAGLAEELGFEAVDIGPLARARELEHLALLWIALAYQQGLGPDFGFALLRRERAPR